MAQETAYIGLGSNLGNRRQYLDNALKMLSEASQVELGRVSDFIETAALGGKSQQPDYLNAVAEFKTSLEPEDLHKKLIEIENSLGRERKGKWASRTIDLDLLLFGDHVINTDKLTVPHKQMHLRSFVLKGLSQLNPELIHPVMEVSAGELLSRLNGCDFAINPDVPQLISIAGNIGVGKTTLAKKLAEYFSCEILYEPYDTNPFLPEVYAGKNELSLDSQLYFLTRRVKQLSPDCLLSNQVYVSDYIFDKELIYARALLDSKQLALYEDIYEPLSKNVCNPVLVIYMHDSAGGCLDRIHNRNRPYEQRIELEFLEKIAEYYECLFEGWKKSPVIKITTSDLDYKNQNSVEKILEQISFYVTIEK
ncbi:MAG: 2-amino-4-hydroxy-6-hydroxymethyldihydropteridine diphosphokinase [Sedimentisphaerales bacterium]|nr:2-amino-4-hydroxy-6-hydroxymethyldihydropteridine diphosphokinase [Sedimentisphaerales bacterium]